MNPETPIMRAIRLAVNLDGRARIVRNQTGFDRRIRVTYGLGTGSPDLVGLLRNGRAFVCEVKTPKGRLDKKQKAWARIFVRWGGYWCCARSKEEALDHVTRALAGELSEVPR